MFVKADLGPGVVIQSVMREYQTGKILFRELVMRYLIGIGLSLLQTVCTSIQQLILMMLWELETDWSRTTRWKWMMMRSSPRTAAGPAVRRGGKSVGEDEVFGT